jgi:FTR1 family protein
VIPTLVIALREGVEASLIVGIVAAFLVRESRRDALRWMWVGVGIAIVICSAAAVALRIVGEELPQRQQEGLETVIGLVAVAAISYMVVWMRRHSRGLKAALEGSAAHALAAGSTAALVGMAFLAVLREGFETSVFMLAAFQDSTDTTAAGAGAVVGLVAAIALGIALYRGGVRINLSRFFRATGLVLVLVAAGLLATSIHTAHEAGWLNGMQAEAIDLSWLVKPGTISGSLLTGMLGLQPNPTVGEAAAYLLYAVPMGLYVVWPDRWRRRPSEVPVRSAEPQVAAAAPAPGAGRVGAATRMAVGGVAVATGAAMLAGCGSSGDPAGAKKLSFQLTDAGCEPAAAKAPAGPVTIEVTNAGTADVTELEVLDGDRILGERENITEGLSGSFSLTLTEGEYTLYCPNGTESERGTLTVTGKAKAASAPELRAAATRYRAYVERNTALLVERTKPFVAAVKAGDVALAKELYPAARAPYERIEPVAESFGGLDPEIDARINDVPRRQFGGFHRIEQALWVADTTEGMAPVAHELLADVERLQRKAARLELEAAQIANGATTLLDEVSASKITGEEERYSHIDLYDFEGNVEGSQAAFKAVEPILRGDDPELADEIDQRFAAVFAALDPYRRGDGFVLYTSLSAADKKKLAQAIDALAEPLSGVAGQIVS